jgi:atypical dual specificity phosphatase
MKKFFPVLQVSLNLFRSPQPDFEDLIALKDQGIRSVINLRKEAEESEFFARQCGLKYLHIGVTDWQLPSLEQVWSFMDFVADKANGPALVHCAAGVGRTGTFVACYRIAHGMRPEDALRVSNSESPLLGVTMNQIQQEFVLAFRPADRPASPPG